MSLVGKALDLRDRAFGRVGIRLEGRRRGALFERSGGKRLRGVVVCRRLIGGGFVVLILRRRLDHPFCVLARVYYAAFVIFTNMRLTSCGT